MTDPTTPADLPEPAERGAPTESSGRPDADPADLEMPDFHIPDFDRRKTRRAVRRGIMRTTLTVIVTLALISVVATVGSTWFQQRGDREKRMYDVLGTALQVANPSYEITLGQAEASPLSLSMDVGIRPLRATGGFSAQTFSDRKAELSQDFFGRVRPSPLGAAGTTLTFALYNVGTGNQPKTQMRKVLARLPGTMRALAVVEFSAPITAAQLSAFGKQYNSCPELVVYEKRPRSTPITWGMSMSPSTAKMTSGMCYDSPPDDLSNFRAWVASLQDYDDANLKRLGLDLSRLRNSAAAGKVYAYVDKLPTIEELRKIIDDPRVATVRVADVAYDLEAP